MWKKEGLYTFLIKLLSKWRENFRKMLRIFKKTLRYSFIWKEKTLSNLTLKKTYSALCKVRQNRDQKGCSWTAVILEGKVRSKGMWWWDGNFWTILLLLQQMTRKFWENLEKICEFFWQTSLEVLEYFNKNRESLRF